MSSAPLLPGTTLRPARADDAPAVITILNAVSLKMVGEVEETLEDLERDWSAPHFDLEHSTRVVVRPDGSLVGYGIVYDLERKATPFLDVYLHPDEWARDPLTEPALLAWVESRARENEALIPPDMRLVLRGFSHTHDERFLGVLSAAGFDPIRHSFRMEIDFAEPPAAPPLPAGFSLYTPTREDDWRPVLDAVRDAWRDHWGNIERPFEEQWEHWYPRWSEDFEPGLWLLAVDDADGKTIAGFSLCRLNFSDDPTYGWVGTLGTRRAYRRRGIADALLKQSFAALYARGRTRVGLGVDGLSLTGATRLYENAGMRVAMSYTMVEKELRPGIDPTTQELAVSH